MERNLVYNASVFVAPQPFYAEDMLEDNLALQAARGHCRSKSCAPALNSDMTDFGDLEFASFETALESPTGQQSERETSALTVGDRKPRHRTVDIATLKEVANGIEIDDILDGWEDVQDEGAPRQMPRNELVCYFKRKTGKDFRLSPAISVSTVDTTGSVQSSPIQLPPSSSDCPKAPKMLLTERASVESEADYSGNATSEQEGEADIKSLEPEQILVPCACGAPAHFLAHDPQRPIKTCPSVKPGSYEEALTLARAEEGHWVTILERSQSLDVQYKHMGLNYMKRAIMNRLSVPLTLFLEADDTIIHVHVHTPIGIRHMRADITGQPIIDEDPDCGAWEGVSSVVDYSIPWFCNGTPVRALRQKRHNKKVGTIIETRCILPDDAEGKIMLMNFALHAAKDPGNPIYTDRILRYIPKPH